MVTVMVTVMGTVLTMVTVMVAMVSELILIYYVIAACGLLFSFLNGDSEDFVRPELELKRKEERSDLT